MRAKTMHQMLSEFPFLWAIKKKWLPEENEIKAVCGNKLIFQADHHFDDDSCYEIWLVQSAGSKNKFLEIILVYADPGTRLGAAILDEMPAGYSVEYVVFLAKHNRQDEITVYKPLDKTSLNELILCALKEVE